MKTITLRLPDQAYEAIKRYADDDHRSMNAWIETILDAEDTRRRCATHQQWMATNPDTAAFAEAWADQNFDELAQR